LNGLRDVSLKDETRIEVHFTLMISTFFAFNL